MYYSNHGHGGNGAPPPQRVTRDPLTPFPSNQYVRAPHIKDLTSAQLQEWNEYQKHQGEKRRRLTHQLPPPPPRTSQYPLVTQPADYFADTNANVYTRIQSTPIIINSADRNLADWPHPNQFQLNLDRSYHSVYQIQMTRLEMTNAHPIIKDASSKSQNNIIQWINQEDVDLGYPMYSVSLAAGNYTADSLQNEIQMKMSQVRRRNGLGAYHSFQVSIDTDSSLITIVSVRNQGLGATPFEVTAGSDTVTVTAPHHGFLQGDDVYVSNANGLGGLSPMDVNGTFTVIPIDADHFAFEVRTQATLTAKGGGNSILVGASSAFKLMFGEISNSVCGVIGFDQANSAQAIFDSDIFTTKTLAIYDVVPGVVTTFKSIAHGLEVGQYVQITGLLSTPALTEQNNKLEIIAIPSLDTFTVAFSTHSIDMASISNCVVGTGLLTVRLVNHGFNTITNVSNDDATAMTSDYQVIVTTQLPHFVFDPTIFIGGTSSTPSLYGIFNVVSVLDRYRFVIKVDTPLTSPGSSGLLRVTQDQVIFYGVKAFDGFPINLMNNIGFYIEEIINKDTFTIYVPSCFAKSVTSGGGSGISISSDLHGFNATQSNIDPHITAATNALLRPVSLAGDDYALICIKGLGAAKASSGLRDIFCKVQLDQGANVVCFNANETFPKIFSPQFLDSLSTLEFAVYTPAGELFEFQGINWSATLLIHEAVNTLGIAKDSGPDNYNASKSINSTQLNYL